MVELRGGARVIDAVEAVGGALADGDLDRLNLAAKVTDGQRVFVAKVGQADPGVTDAGGGDAGGDGRSRPRRGPGRQGQPQHRDPGAARGAAGHRAHVRQAIIAERQRRGGFTSVNDLRSVRGIGDKRFAELAPLVTV